ncbi:PAS domain-containing protein [Neorhizobium sp. NPDC001467]|uniref:PAS domain-containing protein n=1 Tax=Neorhizobium sp. NPDC001467 TaxID=3390595 RepID=UPI003D074B29
MSELETTVFALSSDDAAVFHWNVDANLLCADEHFAEIFGLDAQAVLDGLPIETYLNCVWEGDRASVAKTLHRAISIGGSCFQDYHIARSDGTFVHVIGIGRCFRNIEGEATRYVGVVFDDVELTADQARDLLSACRHDHPETAPGHKNTDPSTLAMQTMEHLEEEKDQRNRRVVMHH